MYKHAGGCCRAAMIDEDSVNLIDGEVFLGAVSWGQTKAALLCVTACTLGMSFVANSCVGCAALALAVVSIGT